MKSQVFKIHTPPGQNNIIEFIIAYPDFFIDYKVTFYSIDDAYDSFLIKQIFELPFRFKKIEILNDKLSLYLDNPDFKSTAEQEETINADIRFDILESEILALVSRHFDSGLKLFEDFSYEDKEIAAKAESKFLKPNLSTKEKEPEIIEKKILVLDVEKTPNPYAFKFIIDKKFENHGLYFDSIESATNSKLARQIFSIPTVMSVYFGEDFITITVDSLGDFEKDSLRLIEIIQASDQIIEKFETQDLKELSPIEQEIVRLLDKMIRPSIQMDGGDVRYKSFQDGIVTLEFIGACSGCPSSTITLKDGIERTLKRYIPEITEIISI